MTVPELLSPAGDWDCLRAAVANGADAVYFGLPRFNARLRAQNFQADELGEVMAYLHRYGRKGFVTFNTLIFPAELETAAEQLRLLQANSVDAIIVQDIGLTLLARRVTPRLEVHASTQMTITSPEGLAFAGGLGVRRAVLARELSLKELQRFQGGPVPIEVFVHGALCVAYSGQCLTSESLGQRSANRGECAQACRMPYQLVVNGEIRDLGDRRFLLSPQDLAGVQEIPDLIRLGVTSFKIEGRLKSPEYVAAVTKIYRNAIDAAVKTIEQETAARELPESDRYALEMTFSRGFYSGWLHGVNHQKLVEGSFGKKRGALIGRVVRVSNDSVELDDVNQLKLGDGLVFENPADTDNEEGGRIFEIRNNELRFANGKLRLDRIRIGSRIWKTSDPVLERKLRSTFERDPSIPVDISVEVVPGERLRARFSAGGAATEVVSSIPVAEAKSIPLTTESLKINLGRLGEADCYELVIHQHMPMFHMEHCVFAAFLSNGTDHTNCGRPCDRYTVQLHDRVGARHVLKADVGCRNTLFNSRAQTGAEFFSALRLAGLSYFRFELLNEDRHQAADILKTYQRLLEGRLSGDELVRRLRITSQLGVTSGTLAVVDRSPIQTPAVGNP